MRTVSPASLEEICLSYICANIEDLCHEVVNDVQDICEVSFQKLSFISPIFLHEQLAENIVKCLSCNGKLTNRTASLFINPRTCRIRKFYLRKCQVDGTMLKLLFSKHRVVRLDLNGTKMLSSSLLFELLNGMALTVRELNLSHTSFFLDFSVVWPLKHLTHLDVSNTPINDKAMFDASQNLYHLEHINISNTTISDVTSFGNLRGQLKTLLAYNAPVTWTEPAEFKNFTSIQKLDISRNTDDVSGYDWPAEAMKLEEMLTDQEMMPDLVYFDVSGIPMIKEAALHSFLCFHPKLQFLGLCKTGLTSEELLESMSPFIEVHLS